MLCFNAPFTIIFHCINSPFPFFCSHVVLRVVLHVLVLCCSAPFTIQRLCEIMVDPTRHYRRTDKFLRGLEKNVLVVSSIEPGIRQYVSYHPYCLILIHPDILPFFFISFLPSFLISLQPDILPLFLISLHPSFLCVYISLYNETVTL